MLINSKINALKLYYLLTLGDYLLYIYDIMYFKVYAPQMVSVIVNFNFDTIRLYFFLFK